MNEEYCIMDGQKEDRRLDFIVKKFTVPQLLDDVRWKRHVKGELLHSFIITHN